MTLFRYCFRAQLAQLVQFKALFEGFKGRMWDMYTAVIFWKSQSPYVYGLGGARLRMGRGCARGVCKGGCKGMGRGEWVSECRVD